jgi:hypothetical protein
VASVTPYTFAHYAASTTATVVKATAGWLHTVVVNSIGTAAAYAFYDVASASCTNGVSTNPIAIGGTLATVGGTATYDLVTANGICIVITGTTPDITVSYK